MRRVHVGEELSDILIYLVELAECCYVDDLPLAILHKFELNAMLLFTFTNI